jgi:hypothetical protein
MTRYKLEPSISLLPQQQPVRSFRVSIIVLICLFGLSARCIQFVQLALIYSTHTSLCQSVGLSNSVCRRRVGNRSSTSDRGSTCYCPQTVRARVGHTQPVIQRLPGASACRQSGRGMSLITDLNPELRLRINGAIPPFSISLHGD